MFPRLKQRLAPAVLGRLDVLVELSTLGEYGLDEAGRAMTLGAAAVPATSRESEAAQTLAPALRSGQAAATGRAPLARRRRDDCPGRPDDYPPGAEASARRCGPPARS